MKKQFFIFLVCVVIALNAVSMFAATVAHDESMACAQGSLTLDVTFGDHPGYLTWVIRDSTGNGVIAQINYGSQTPNTTIQSSIDMYLLGSGDYNFTMVNNHGLGMEGGSYTLSYNGMILAQGSNFTYSEATSFCYLSPGAGTNDVTPPTNPTNLVLGATTATSADISWDPSTDAQSAFVYGIVINEDFTSVISTQNTSFTLTNLTPGVNYNVAVIAADMWGNISVQATNTLLINTGTTTCASNNLTLQLNFDANPQEISWLIMDANDTMVAFGNNYVGQSMVTVPITGLSNGDYVFVIQDMGGDGNTSYSLGDGNVTVASGSVFPYSESTQFCVGNSNNDILDTVPPSAPRNLFGNNVTQTSVDLQWGISYDNVGVTQYAIFQDGVYTGYVPNTTTSLTVPGLQPGTTYSYKLVARDLVGNISAESNSITITTQPAITETVLHQGFFETGLDGWIDGGSDCARVTDATRSYENSRSMQLRDNSGTASSMTLSQNVQGYDAVELSFFMRGQGMDNGDDFWVRYYNGSTWTTVASFTKGPHFTNDEFYEVKVMLSAAQYNLVSNAQFRIQNDATNDNDRIYVDQTKLVGYTGGSWPSTSSITLVTNAAPITIPASFEEVANNGTLSLDIALYPNPASQYFQLQGIAEAYSLTVYDLQGKKVKEFKARQDEYYVGDLSKGTYIIVCETVSQKKAMKFIKQ
ncbi:MAG: fibronectin type III domain-containing protein [Flavobacteriaceae bacterium]